MSKDEVERIGKKFRDDMKRLGLGVRIKAGDSDWITIAEEPKKKAEKQ